MKIIFCVTVLFSFCALAAPHVRTIKAITTAIPAHRPPLIKKCFVLFIVSLPSHMDTTIHHYLAYASDDRLVRFVAPLFLLFLVHVLLLSIGKLQDLAQAVALASHRCPPLATSASIDDLLGVSSLVIEGV